MLGHNFRRDKSLKRWPDRPIKCLGVYFTYDVAEFVNLNFKRRSKKMQKTSNWWKARGLTLYGRVQIINSLLPSKMLYIDSMFSVPEEVIKDLNKIVYKFLWKGQDRVARTVMINTYENGDVKVLDFETLVKSLRLAWLKRIIDDNENGWKSYLKHLLKDFGGLFLFHCDYDPKDYVIGNQFYSELLQFWVELRNAFSEGDTKNAIIWNNKNIRINGKPVFYKRFFDKNIIAIKQLRL